VAREGPGFAFSRQIAASRLILPAKTGETHAKLITQHQAAICPSRSGTNERILRRAGGQAHRFATAARWSLSNRKDFADAPALNVDLKDPIVEVGTLREECALRQHLADEIVKVLDPRRSERIYDIGCGDGYLTEKLPSYGARLVGVD
jgi:protein-L-isoaspartate O-methyltransferase